MKTLFTGIQPTGELHMGNYFGAVKNWITLQHSYTSFFSIVDYHSVTILYEPAEMPARVMDLAIGLMACGIDAEKSRLFVQSEVPGHADLTWIFNTLTPLGELERMTQFKDKARQNRDNLNVGLLDYPVLQAADILIYKGEVVPVGEDQVQHIEFTREIARYFNRRFGDTFPECKALLTPTPRIMGLDGESKMSKSKGNYIGVFEDPDAIWEKLRPAKTDPARIKRTDPGTPEKCNIFSYHRLFTPEPELSEIHEGCSTAGIGCIDCKKVLHKNMMNEFDPLREKYYTLQAAPEKVRELLDANADACRETAAHTILEVKEKMGLNPVWKI
ncbi:MAG TPA: tryptophan--tRNA ligase [Spirochaetia bacterium]|nr:tryptophan--tRNA ligase [Spirochaetia bacterium]